MLKLVAYFKILIALTILAASSFWLLYLSVKFTRLLQSESLLSKNQTLRFPSNLEEVQSLSLLLKKIYTKHTRLVLIFYSSAYLYKQTFAIPGSFFLNLLSGSLFGLYHGMIICCTLSTLGALGCFYLSKLCGEEILEYFFKKKLAEVRKKVNNKSGSVFFFLLSCRLFPASPNWFINISSPIIGIPWYLFASSCFLGLIPCIYLCVQTGEILNEIKSIRDVYSTSSLIKTTVIALVGFAPSIWNFFKKEQSKESKNPENLKELKNPESPQNLKKPKKSKKRKIKKVK